MPSIAQSGETIDSFHRDVFPGGKGLNQSIAAAKAGCSVRHFGAVGPDGEELLTYLAAQQVDVSAILRSEAPSGHAFIQVDSSGQNAIVIHGGCNRALSDDYWQSAIDSLSDGDWLLLQNETNAVGEMITYARTRGVRVAINLAPADASVRDLPINETDLLIVNEAEACMLADKPQVADAFDALCAQFEGVDIVLTLGKDGLRTCTGVERAQAFMSAFDVEAVDETAAGDAFVGYLMAALVTGASIADASRQASAAGALAVTKAGAAPSIPTRAAVLELLG